MYQNQHEPLRSMYDIEEQGLIKEALKFEDELRLVRDIVSQLTSLAGIPLRR